MARVYITTTDNPYDPETQFEDWFAFDESAGYHTCSYLARLINSSSIESPETAQYEKERAIDSIVSLNLTGNYKKIVKE